MLKKIQNYIFTVSELFFPIAAFFILAQFNERYTIGKIGRSTLYIYFLHLFFTVYVCIYLFQLFKKFRIKINDTYLKKIGLFVFTIILIQAISTARGTLIRQVERPITAYLIILFFIWYYFVMIFSYKSFKTTRHIKIFMTIIFIYLICYCIYCLSSIWIFDNRFLFTPFTQGTEYWSNSTALFFLPLFFFVFGFFNEQNLKKKLLFIIPLILLGLCSIYSYSRPALITLHYYLAFLIILKIRGWKNIVAGIIIWIVLLFFITQIQDIKNYIEKTFEGNNEIRVIFLPYSEKYINVNDDIYNKIDRAERIVSYWGEYPIFGLGVTGAGFIDSQWFKLLGETGIIGIFAYLIFFAYLFRFTAKIKRNSADSFLRGIIAGFRCYIGAVIILSFFMNTFLLLIFQIVFGILTALILRINFILTAEANKI